MEIWKTSRSIARAGAIVPLRPEVGWGGVENPVELNLLVFPGADNRFELVEDDGETTAYLHGAYAVTVFTQSWRADEMTFTVSPARGDLSVLPAERRLRIMLRGCALPGSVTVRLNGQEIPLNFEYDPNSDTLVLEALTLKAVDDLIITIQAAGASLVSERDRSARRCGNTCTRFA